MHSHKHAAKAAASEKLRRMTSNAGAPKGDGMGLSPDAPDYHEGRFGDDGMEDNAAKSINKTTRGYKRGGRVEGKQPKMRLDRPARKSGGRVAGKGKTTVNIIMGGDKQPMPMPVPVPAGGAGPAPMPPRPQMPPPGMPVAMPMQAGPMGTATPPQPMPGRKRGGRVAGLSAKDGGAGSGEGRLAKTAMQKRVK